MKRIWIARDKYGALWSYSSKPVRDDLSDCWAASDDLECRYMPEDWFPDLCWEDEPLELIAKRDAINALDEVLDDWVHGGDEDCIIADFERELSK